MINVAKLGSSGGMIERAAMRVRVAHLEKQRAAKLYKLHLKDTKTTEDAIGDVVLDQLRSDMQTARANYFVALETQEAVGVCPPAR